jgi:hypothetical protein
LIIAPIAVVSGMLLPLLVVTFPYAFIIYYKYCKSIYGKGLTLSGYELIFYMLSLMIFGASAGVTTGYLGLNY